MFGLFFLGVKNVIQYIKLEDKSFSNIFQIGFSFIGALLYSLFKGAGIDIQPFLIGVTIVLFIMLILEAISLGRAWEKNGKNSVTNDKHMSRELRRILSTFVCNLSAFIFAALQIAGFLEKIFLSL
jgi:hypothetical protein